MTRVGALSLVTAMSTIMLMATAAARIAPQGRQLYEQPDLLHGECTNATELLEGHIAPLAESRPRVLTAKFAIGVTDRRTDNYYWLRDDKRTSPEVLAHLEAENNYTTAVMAPTEGLQDALYEEMKARIPPAEVYPPQRRDGFWYYWYRVPGGQYAIFARRQLPAGMGPPAIDDKMDTRQPEQVLLDENAIAKSSGSSYLAVGTASLPRSGAWLAYSLDLKGDEAFKLYVRNVTYGASKAAKSATYGPIPNVAGGGVQWANDNFTFFCITQEPVTKRASTLWRYSVSARGLSKPVMIHNETDAAFSLYLQKSRASGMLYLYSASGTTSSVIVLDADRPTGVWNTLGPRVHARQIQQVEERGGQLFMLVTDAARRNGELLTAPVAKPARTSVLVEHDVDVRLEAFTLSRDFLTLLAREKGVVTPIAHPLPENLNEDIRALGEGRVLELPEEGATVGFEEQGPFDSAVGRIHYSSLITPPSSFDFDLATGERATKLEQEVVGGYNREEYQSERLWARAPDGVEVPISLVYRKDLVRVGGAGSPLLLEGYGAYGIAVDPFFDTARLSLLDRGFVWAFAHVRGGGELGAYWYQAGKLLNKRNTFIDFIACAEHLIKEGYTSEERLAVESGSAGGLTIGASLNMKPGLFKAAVMGVPFVDPLTTERDTTLPLTVGEWEEWGDPLHNETVYQYMKSYSPYDNVARQAYPHLLVTTSLNDPRVGYWEPAKLVAELRALATSEHLLLLKVNMEAGHFSASGIYDHLREVALKYAFYMHALSACTDDGGGGGRPLHDYAFIATACLAGLVVLVGLVMAACFWGRTRKGADAIKEVKLRTFPQHAGFARMEFESPVPENAETPPAVAPEPKNRQKSPSSPQRQQQRQQQQQQQPRQALPLRPPASPPQQHARR